MISNSERKKIPPNKMVKFLIKWYNDIDKKTLAMVIGLSIFGIFSVASSSPSVAERINVSSYHFFAKHLMYMLFGIFLMLLISMVRDDAIVYFSKIGFNTCLVLLLLVLLIGSEVKGSKRWIDFGIFSIQPSELLKPFFVVIIAKNISSKIARKFTILKAFAIMILVLILLVLQPDFGSSVVYISTWSVQIFIGDLSWKLVLFVAPFAMVLFITGFFAFPHFRFRIESFFSGSGGIQYQVKKSIEAIQNGGFFGQGIGDGTVKNKIPDAHTDYIFSVIIEEFGILFSFLILSIFLILIVHTMLKASKIKNEFRRNIIFGCIFAIAIETIINVSVSLNLLPSKGMALPFISYGGSSTISTYMIFGIILALTRKSYKFKSPFRRIN